LDSEILSDSIRRKWVCKEKIQSAVGSVRENHNIWWRGGEKWVDRGAVTGKKNTLKLKTYHFGGKIRDFTREDAYVDRI
jgi:hypothetical protein